MARPPRHRELRRALVSLAAMPTLAPPTIVVTIRFGTTVSRCARELAVNASDPLFEAAGLTDVRRDRFAADARPRSRARESPTETRLAYADPVAPGHLPRAASCDDRSASPATCAVSLAPITVRSASGFPDSGRHPRRVARCFDHDSLVALSVDIDALGARRIVDRIMFFPPPFGGTAIGWPTRLRTGSAGERITTL